MVKFRIPTIPQAHTEGTGGGNASTPGVKEGEGNTNTLTTGTETTDNKAGGAATDTSKAGTTATTEGTTATTEGSKDGAAAAAPKAPDKYDLTIPDAAKGLIAESDVKRFETIARQNNWTQEDAAAMLAEQVALVQQQHAEYLEAAKKDAEIGGDKLPVSQALANKVIDRVRPANHARRAAFLGFLNRGGASSHPEVIAFLADLGRLMGEDSPPSARSSSGNVERDPASVLYDKSGTT